MRFTWTLILILFASPAPAKRLFLETELLTITRDIYSVHAGLEIRPNRVDVFGTYMGGWGSRINGDSIFSSGADFYHRCLGLGFRVNRNSRANGFYDSYSLRYARTEWSANPFEPIQDKQIAFIWSQAWRHFFGGTYYAAWSFDLGIQRIHRLHPNRDEVILAPIVGLSLSLGFYTF